MKKINLLLMILLNKKNYQIFKILIRKIKKKLMRKYQKKMKSKFNKKSKRVKMKKKIKKKMKKTKIQIKKFWKFQKINCLIIKTFIVENQEMIFQNLFKLKIQLLI